MNPQSRIGTALPVLLLALGAAGSAPAQPRPAPPTLDVLPLPQALDGKTCQGTFNSGHEREASEGALMLRFSAAGGQLTAQMWRVVGADAFNREAYALTRTQRAAAPPDASAYQPLGPVRDLSVAGDQIRYVDPTGARVELTYKGSDLTGESDPRGGTDPQMTRLQFVNLRCR